MSLGCDMTLDAGLVGMLAELVKYFNHQTLKSVEPVDAIQFDILDFWWKKERK